MDWDVKLKHDHFWYWWKMVWFCLGYNAPYLSVYSENAVDVFDVNTMEWIQTIPLKKVSICQEGSTAGCALKNPEDPALVVL